MGGQASGLSVSSVQSLSHIRLFSTSWTAAAPQASLSITNSWSLPELMSIESVIPSNHLIQRCLLLLQPSILPSISVFSNESVLRIRWPKYWSFSFSISPSNFLWMEWLGLLAVQGTLKSLLQHHSSKASVILGDRGFMFQPRPNWKSLFLSEGQHMLTMHNQRQETELPETESPRDTQKEKPKYKKEI